MHNDPMNLLAFKLILPPLLILFATLAGRRWGDSIGGWLVGLPLTTGPILVFLAIEYGTDFAATATNGSQVGTAGQAFFCLGYALAARWGWLAAFLMGAASYAGSAFLIQAVPLGPWGFFAVALAALTMAAKFIPHRAAPLSPVPAPRWDLPARMVVVMILVVTLTASAEFFGPEVVGVLSSFPILGTTLAIFAHRMKGAEMARQVLRGMVFALYGFGVCMFALGLLLPKLGIVLAFLISTVCCLLVQAGVLRFIRQ